MRLDGPELADFAHSLPEQRPLEPLTTIDRTVLPRRVGHAFFVNRRWLRLRLQSIGQHS